MYQNIVSTFEHYKLAFLEYPSLGRRKRKHNFNSFLAIENGLNSVKTGFVERKTYGTVETLKTTYMKYKKQTSEGDKPSKRHKT